MALASLALLCFAGCRFLPAITESEWVVKPCDNGVMTITYGFGAILDPDTTAIGPSEICMELAEFQARMGAAKDSLMLNAKYIRFTVSAIADTTQKEDRP
ncbi:MAG: hypothetical protein WC869_16570 [Phycisphaerae bacterium]|jgi:hypothetical protein